MIGLTIRYPNGKKYEPTQHPIARKKTNLSFSNRGKTLEDELNESNEYYLSRSIAVIHKKPVPIQIVHVKYPARSAAVITEAYFRSPSTTDFNGIWNGKYIDFEAKETTSRTSFPLNNIHEHQVEHMKKVTELDGIAFLIIKFTTLERYFIVPYAYFEKKWERKIAGGRKSMTLSEIEEMSIEIQAGFNPRLDYLAAVELHLQSSLTERIERQENK